MVKVLNNYTDIKLNILHKKIKMIKKAKFNIGDIVTHKRQGYDAIIIDIDPIFQASGQHNPAAQKKFKNRSPWYRLLVDESNQMTYVEEGSLDYTERQEGIDNPKINQFLSKKDDSGYQSNQVSH
jgi:heat shock protein HspQ